MRNAARVHGLAALLGLSASACSFLIDAPDARFSFATRTVPDAGPWVDAGMDSAVVEHDAATLDDAGTDADTPVDASADAQSCTSHAQCVAPIEACRTGGLCNGETGTCEYTVANDCTPCGEPAAVCVLGTCRAKGVIYAYDFEGPELGDEWSGSPLRPWTLTHEEHRDGGSQVAGSAMMLVPGDGSNLELRARNVPKEARISFLLRVSSQVGNDHFAFYIRRSSTVFDESEPRDQWSGHHEWQPLHYEVRADGDVTFTWRFLATEDDVIAGENRAYIDDVLIDRLCD